MVLTATSAGNALPSRGALLLAQVLSQPLAILPSMREQMLEIVARHTRGEVADIALIEAKLGRPLANEQQGYQVVDGIAVVSASGPIFAKANMLQAISGGTSAQLLERDVRAAGADTSVRGIILAIDSPGGSVLGTPEAARAIRDVAAVKPTVAHVDGLMASAAYWVGSAANAIFLTGPTVTVGSIGVVSTHVDRSGADAEAGLKRTEITAGKYKRIASDTAPLSPDGAAAMQGQVDAIYSIFVETVADNRGTSVADVLDRMADGRVFIGQQAIDAGLADGFASLNSLVRTMAADPSQFARRRTARRGTLNTPAAPARAVAAASAGEVHMATPRPPVGHYTDTDAVAYSARHGVRLATARAALNVEPEARGRRTRQQIAEACSAYVGEHGGSFGAAFHAVSSDEEYDGAPTAQAVLPAPKSAQQQLVEEAKTFAEQHKVDFVMAVKALGADPCTSSVEARLIRYSIEHKCSRAEACKALARSA